MMKIFLNLLIVIGFYIITAAFGQNADPWLGKFSDGKATFIIQGSQDNYIGTLTFVNTSYAATAKIKEGILVGSFTSNTSKFPFEAFLEGDTLSFTTEGKHYSLIREVDIEFIVTPFQPLPLPISEGIDEIDYQNQPVWGNPEAAVKVAFFQDFMCSHCAAFTEDVQPQLIQTYKDNEEVAFYFFNYPLGVFGPPSISAALAGECAYNQDNDAFWDYKTILMRSQDNMRTNHSPEFLGELARSYVPELDEEELVTCIGEERFAEDINNDKAVGEKNLISSTPTVFVNGGRVEKDGWSDPSLPSIANAIEHALNMLEVDE